MYRYYAITWSWQFFNFAVPRDVHYIESIEIYTGQRLSLRKQKRALNLWEIYIGDNGIWVILIAVENLTKPKDCL